MEVGNFVKVKNSLYGKLLDGQIVEIVETTMFNVRDSKGVIWAVEKKELEGGVEIWMIHWRDYLNNVNLNLTINMHVGL